MNYYVLCLVCWILLGITGKTNPSRVTYPTPLSLYLSLSLCLYLSLSPEPRYSPRAAISGIVYRSLSGERSVPLEGKCTHTWTHVRGGMCAYVSARWQRQKTAIVLLLARESRGALGSSPRLTVDLLLHRPSDDETVGGLAGGGQ